MPSLTRKLRNVGFKSLKFIKTKEGSDEGDRYSCRFADDHDSNRGHDRERSNRSRSGRGVNSS